MITIWKGVPFRKQLAAWLERIESNGVTSTTINEIVILNSLTDYNQSEKLLDRLYVWKTPLPGIAIGVTVIL